MFVRVPPFILFFFSHTSFGKRRKQITGVIKLRKRQRKSDSEKGRKKGQKYQVMALSIINTTAK